MVGYGWRRLAISTFESSWFCGLAVSMLLCDCHVHNFARELMCYT